MDEPQTKYHLILIPKSLPEQERTTFDEVRTALRMQTESDIHYRWSANANRVITNLSRVRELRPDYDYYLLVDQFENPPWAETNFFDLESLLFRIGTKPEMARRELFDTISDRAETILREELNRRRSQSSQS